jgi:N-glycosylase/DNA lyase
MDHQPVEIAIRDYSFPSTRTTSLTPALHDKVATFLASRWGPYAGWAQQVLFFADLAKPSAGSPSKKSAVYVKEELKVDFEEGEGEDGERKRKLTFEEEVAALIATPGAKRSRRTVVQKTTVKVEIEEDGGESDSSGLSSVTSSPARKEGKGRAKVKKEE